MSYDRKIVAACLLLALLIGCFTLLNILFPLPKERLSRDSSPQYLDRHGQVVRIFLAPDDSWHLPLSSLDRFSPSLQQAVLAYEDRWFYWHLGVNPISIAQALLANLWAKRIIRGGST
ncbi:MAG: transglycosylase domain-containing protein, partial [Candidatus Poribacteria bacterium]|nr:transglycosylase domain-containing protein [Candidatus Poribacteria bacterium]